MVAKLKANSELVTAAKNGDKEAFASLYELVQDELYKYALYSLGNAHDAEDVVAEAFLEAYRGISKLRDPEAFHGWIFRILTVRIKRRIGRYIQEKRQLQIEDFAADPALQSDGMDLEVVHRADLVAAFSTLSTQERMIISLSVLHGYTTKQIAQTLSCPQGTISSKLHRSFAKLKKHLEMG